MIPNEVGPELVGEYQQPSGWMSPIFSERERLEAERDAEERRKYLAQESQRELARFQTRQSPPSPPFQPKTPTGKIDMAKLIEIIDAISTSGLHIDRAKLIAKGKERFGELQALGRQIPPDRRL
jgi:hypothetical protein